MAQVKFFRGAAASYNAAKHADAIYFATDSHELILNDDQFKRADLNKDGILSSVEALRILQYINKHF